MKTVLLLIDVQNDFHPGGSLAIPSAKDDADRIARFIERYPGAISRIVETMDSHHELHIAHGAFWVDPNQPYVHPNPFTAITSEEIANKKWMPQQQNAVVMQHGCYEEVEGCVDGNVFKKSAEMLDSDGNLDLHSYCLEYTKLLEAKGRFQLTIWPEHCIIGTEGHNVVPCVRKAMMDWSKSTGNSVEWVHKGQNRLTEMYSALQAEVPVTISTAFNSKLLHALAQADRVFVAGQALSHCVNFTVRDMVDNWPKNQTHKICILEDCTSSVPGFEDSGDTFLEDMKKAGVTICTSENAFD